MAKKIYLVRHSTTDWNRLGKIQGHTDRLLDIDGKKEIEVFCEQLVPLGIELIVSSTLKRASETATIVAQKVSVGIELDPRLKECCFGEHEGLTREQVLEKFGETAGRYCKDCHDYDFSPWGGESRKEVLDRHLAVLEELKKQVEFVTNTYKQPALIEEFISGQEFTVAIVGNDNPEVMPIVQIKIDGRYKLNDKFYTFARITSDRLEYICPARINQDLSKKISDLALKTYRAVECRNRLGCV